MIVNKWCFRNSLDTGEKVKIDLYLTLYTLTHTHTPLHEYIYIHIHERKFLRDLSYHNAECPLKEKKNSTTNSKLVMKVNINLG